MPLPPDVQYNMTDESSLPMATATTTTTASCAINVNAENAQTQTTASASPCNSICQSSPCTSPTPMMAAPSASVHHHNHLHPVPMKRKRSINPQADENFVKALEAVRFGGIGFCKAARMYGVNNRTLWLEYKKRGYPISRVSIKSRVKVEQSIASEQQQQHQHHHQQQQQQQQQQQHGDGQQQQQQHQMLSHSSSEPNNVNHTQPVICQPPHSVAMIGATFPADFAPSLQRPYQDTSMMTSPSSHIAIPCTVNFSQI